MAVAVIGGAIGLTASAAVAGAPPAGSSAASPNVSCAMFDNEGGANLPSKPHPRTCTFVARRENISKAPRAAMVRLRWRRWGAATATAVGTFTRKKRAGVRANVAASGLKYCYGVRGGERYYSRVRVTAASNGKQLFAARIDYLCTPGLGNREP